MTAEDWDQTADCQECPHSGGECDCDCHTATSTPHPEPVDSPVRKGDLVLIQVDRTYDVVPAGRVNYTTFHLARVDHASRDGVVRQASSVSGQSWGAKQWTRLYVIPRHRVDADALWHAEGLAEPFGSLDEATDFIRSFRQITSEAV